MKTRFALATLAALALPLTACGGSDDKAASSGDGASSAPSTSVSQTSIPITVTSFSAYKSANVEAKEDDKICADVLGVNQASGDSVFLPLKDKSGLDFSQGSSFISESEGAGFQCGQSRGDNDYVRFFFFATTNTSDIDDWTSTLKKDWGGVVRVDAPNGVTVLTDAKGADSAKAKAFMKDIGQTIMPS